VAFHGFAALAAWRHRASEQEDSMATRARDTGDSEVFGVLGMNRAEERAYQVLLAHPGLVAASLADPLRISSRKASQLLARLAQMGLATHSPERPRRYFAAPPDIGFEALILKQEAALQRARRSALELKERNASRPAAENPDERLIEVITNPVAAGQLFFQMARTVREEMVCLARPPLLFSSTEKREDVFPRAAARGVRFRTVVDSSILQVDGILDVFRADAQAGTELRLVPSLPLKLVMIDRRCAIMPLDLTRPDGPVLFLRSSSLLDAFYVLFEMIWAQSAPLALDAADPPGAVRGGARGRAVTVNEQLVPLLSAGFNDKTIADQLGVSWRTLERRIVELMRELDARTRFQAGFLIGCRSQANRKPKGSRAPDG
jgi:sugar-specific transcriptional regulator TrmB